MREAARRLGAGGPRVLELVTRSAAWRLCGPLDALLVLAWLLLRRKAAKAREDEEQVVFSPAPLSALRGLSLHASQGTWYRYVFALCSCYSLVNVLRPLTP